MRNLTIPLLLLLVGCFPRSVDPASPELRPFYAAMATSPRLALGFTPIQPNARIRLEEGPRHNYDVMLHVSSTTSRTIAFGRTASGYVWLGEQEIYTGPRTMDTPDGIISETITVTFDTVSISGFPINQLCVWYWGPDERLSMARHLTLAEVQPLIRSWTTGVRKP